MGSVTAGGSTEFPDQLDCGREDRHRISFPDSILSFQPTFNSHIIIFLMSSHGISYVEGSRRRRLELESRQGEDDYGLFDMRARRRPRAFLLNEKHQ